MRKVFSHISVAVSGLLVSMFSVSCHKVDPEPVSPAHYDNVLLLYSAGYNSLCVDLEEDVNDIKKGYLPSKSDSKAVLVFSKRKKNNDYYYAIKTPAYLIQLFKDGKGNVVSDTVKTWPAGTVAASTKTLNEVLGVVRDEYPSDKYGMIFSSHASGWVPCGYFSSGRMPSLIAPMGAGGFNAEQLVPYVEPEYNPDLPRVKSIGMDNVGSSLAYEMEIEDFAAAIPMKMDYIIMDACLMGGVETAYALHSKCDRLVFSQAEVLADGLCDYTAVTGHLFKKGGADLNALCEDSYRHYDSLTGNDRSLTISMVDCALMEKLAAACRPVFEKYRSQIETVNPYDVQEYFYNRRRHWHYDFLDILEKSGVPEPELEGIRSVLDQCILYKNATEKFFTISIDNYSGLSMFLPSDSGDEELTEFYKSLSWNNATLLVK